GHGEAAGRSPDRGVARLAARIARIRHRVRLGVQPRVPAHHRRLTRMSPHDSRGERRSATFDAPMNAPVPSTAAPAKSSTGFDWLLALAVLAVAGAYVRAIWFTPPEMLQGEAQKIMYIHVPAAWCAFLAFGLTALAGGFWL